MMCEEEKERGGRKGEEKGWKGGGCGERQGEAG